MGNVWATKKDEGISGQKLLIIDVMKKRRQEREYLMVAADVTGAGIGDMVLILRGSPARKVVGDGSVPVDAAVVGIVDSLEFQEDREKDGGGFCGHQ